MKKIISIALILSLLLAFFSGCSILNDPTNDNEQNKDNNSDTNGTNNGVSSDIVEGELDKSSDLVATLVAYLKQYLYQYNLVGRTFEKKIDDIKSGIQPLHIAFDPANYYFVCGYYNSSSGSSDFGYVNCDEYTWVAYKNESDVKEYYNDIKWAVVFQINKALTITDIVSSGNDVPNMEHFQIIKPTFENGVNIAAPIIFDSTFIYLNYPNCYLNKFSQSNSTMYYCQGIYYHSMNTIPCVYLDGDYYLSFYQYTIYADGSRGEEKDNTYTFGQYYDVLMSVMNKDKYSTTDKDGRTTFYGTISVDDFVNDVLK